MQAEEIVIREIKKFPDAPTLTLAKKIYKENPKQFTSVEAVRSMIRYRRGNKGERDRKIGEKNFADYYRENGKAGYKIPKSIAKPEKPFKLCDGRWMIMSDIHIPYHDDEALSLALDYAKNNDIDHILLNGDICDFFSVSRWMKNPDERNLSRELQMTREFLGVLRGEHPDARIVYKIGNHEERWEHYMFTKAPEIVGLTEFEIEKLLNFDKYGVELVKSKQIIKAGSKLTIIHGHEIFGGSSVNPARGLYNQMKVCAIMGHRHQSSAHSEKNADDKFVACWSIGCLCDMKPEYATINKWNHGFAVVDLKGNKFNVNNLRIVNGAINHL